MTGTGTRFDVELAVRLINSAAARVADEAEELSRLDAIAGDGDHGVNMATAFGEAAQRLEKTSPSSVPEVFRTTGTAFTEVVGGASGALFGSFFKAVAANLEMDHPSPGDIADALQRGAERMTKLGRAEPGQKTMIDALVPAVDAARAAARGGADLAATLAAAAESARIGAAATATMTPAAGRARYAPEQSLGSPDPGATTIAVVFAAWAETTTEEVAT